MTQRELELAVIGALLASNSGLRRCDGLEPKHFQDELSGAIFAIARKEILAGRSVDGPRIIELLKDTLIECLTGMVGIISVGDYAEQLRANFHRSRGEE